MSSDASSRTIVEDFIKAQQEDKYPLHEGQLSALRTALLDHAASLDAIASKIAQPILEANATRIGNELPTTGYSYCLLWRTISRAIEQLSSQTDRLVDLVKAISSVHDPSGYMAQMYDLQEYWGEFHRGFCEPDLNDPERGLRRQELINIETFNAKLAARGLQRVNVHRWCDYVFRDGLETTPWEQHYVPDIEEYIAFSDPGPYDEETIAYRDTMVERMSVRRLNYWVPAAAVWIKYDAQGVYNCQGKIGDVRGPLLWKGENVFSKERFHLWRQRFEWVAKVSALDYETRVAAIEAAEIMERIEEP